MTGVLVFIFTDNNGAAANLGFPSSSYEFDGTGDYATIAASSDFVFDSDFSVEAWAYPTTTSGTKVIYTNNMDGTWNSQGKWFSYGKN